MKKAEHLGSLKNETSLFNAMKITHQYHKRFDIIMNYFSMQRKFIKITGKRELERGKHQRVFCFFLIDDIFVFLPL